MDVEAATDEESRSLVIIASVLRGETEWSQENGLLIGTAKTPNPWSPEIREMWTEVLNAVAAEQDRRLDSLDALEATWRLPAISAEDRLPAISAEDSGPPDIAPVDPL